MSALPVVPTSGGEVSLKAWNIASLPRRGWRVIGVGFSTPEFRQFIVCEMCGEEDLPAGYQIAHVKVNGALIACRLCRLAAEGPESVPGFKMIPTDDRRGLALERQRYTSRKQARRANIRSQTKQKRYWRQTGKCQLSFLPRGFHFEDFKATFDHDPAIGWCWSATFADSTTREGGPYATLVAASDAMVEEYLLWIDR